MNFLKNMKRPSIGAMIFWVVTAGLAIGAFVAVKNLTTCWVVTPLPGWAPSECKTVQSGADGPTLTNS
ncbi:MAG TPA: hypothetical protein PLF41_13965, partial [Anaerolineales bacterium]|nr:hypothetical protein [Anaerolineales bacterium]